MRAASAILASLFAVSCAADVGISTRPVVEGRYDGPWQVAVSAAEEFEYEVRDSEGETVAGPFASREFPVPDPRLWSDETPACYTLVAKNESNRVEKVFGFAEMLVVDGKFRVNGRPVRVKLGPKSLNGNAVVSGECPVEDAWREGLYRLTAEDIARFSVEKPRSTPEAARHAFQDWSVKGTNYNQRFVVANRNAFVDANAVDCRWHLLVDGEEVDDGRVDLFGLGPGREASFDMPPEVIAARYRDGTVSVRFTFRKDGETVATDQIDLVASRELNSFNRPEGWLSEYLVPGFLKPSVGCRSGAVRVFTTRKTRFSYGEDGICTGRFEKRGIFDTTLVTSITPCSEEPAENPTTESRPLSSVESRGGALTFVSAGTCLGVECAARLTVYRSGEVTCRSRLRAPSVPRGTRLGLLLGFPPDEFGGRDVTWFGLGPAATKRTEREGSFLGRWTHENLGGEFTMEEVRGVCIGDLTVRTLGAPFGVLVDSSRLVVYGEPDENGVVELSFSLSADDDDLSARTPDETSDLPILPDGGPKGVTERKLESRSPVPWEFTRFIPSADGIKMVEYRNI